MVSQRERKRKRRDHRPSLPCIRKDCPWFNREASSLYRLLVRNPGYLDAIGRRIIYWTPEQKVRHALASLEDIFEK